MGLGMMEDAQSAELFAASEVVHDPVLELRARVAAALVQKFQPFHLVSMVRIFGSLAQAMEAPKAKLRALRGITNEKIKLLRDCIASEAPDLEIESSIRAGIDFLMLGDADYPPALSQIEDPPILLWVRGKLIEEDYLSLAIVGSRNSDHYGNSIARSFAIKFAQRRITVVSGLARGIDTAAHRGALEGGGRTVAVVGSGMKKLYPPENERLATEISKQGAVLSEYALTTPAHPHNFPRRNRIISGLSLGVVVAQAGTRSGSLISARLAGEQGREVFAVPGKIDSPNSKGCHALIRDGAILADSAASVLAELPALAGLPETQREKQSADSGNSDDAQESTAVPPVKPAATTPTEKAILDCFTNDEPVNIEVIAATTGLDIGQLSAALMTLEMRGALRSLPGRNYLLG